MSAAEVPAVSSTSTDSAVLVLTLDRRHDLGGFRLAKHILVDLGLEPGVSTVKGVDVVTWMLNHKVAADESGVASSKIESRF